MPYDSRFWRYVHVYHHQRWGGQSNASFTGVRSCGDKLRLELCIENQTIDQVRYQPKGCAYTAAFGGAVSELTRGRSLEKALRIQPEDVASELGGLPDDHMHCVRLAVNTPGEAIAEYYRRQMTPGKAG